MGSSLQDHLGFYRNKQAVLLMMSGGQSRAGLPADTVACKDLDSEIPLDRHKYFTLKCRVEDMKDFIS